MAQNRRTRGTPALDLIEQMRRSASRSEPEMDIARLARTRRQDRLPVPPIPPRPPVAPGVLESVPTPVATPQNFPGETANDATPTRNVTYDGNNPLVIAAANAAQRYNIPIPLFLAQIQQESRFDPNARSRVGALGLGQLMPATARELGVDPRDPMQNLDGSARYMRQMLDRFGEVPLALAAYNAGPGRVRRAGNTIPNIPETQNYVSTIMRNAGIPGYAEGGLAELDRRYAEGGAVMAGPMAYDPDQIEALAREVEGGAEPQGYAGGGRVRQGLRAVGRAIRGAPEPEAPTGIRTYHGTPHTFPAERLIRRPDGSLEYIVGGRDRLPEIPAGAELVQDFPLGRFRSDKIGTGEGAQVYSHGLYSAEAEPVAESYLQGAQWSYGGRPADEIYQSAYDRVSRPRSTPQDNAAAYFWEQVALNKAPRVVIEEAIRNSEDWPELANYVRTLRPENFNRVGGSMYEVRLNVNPNRLLDWDTSLNAQSPELQENVLRAWREGDFARRTGNPEIPREAFMQTEGGGIARMMSEASPVEAAQALREAGIPGLRYLDQGSRGVGQGTRNYVMYDEGLMEILRRYGLLPGAVGAGAAAATGTEGEAREYAEGGEVSSPEDKEYDRRLIERWRQDQGYRVDNPTWPEQRAAIASAGREAADTAAELLLPQSPLDFALMAALGPGGRAVRIPAAAALAAMEPSEAEANRFRRLIRAYHGSPHTFDRFDISKAGSTTDEGHLGRALYFTTDSQTAMNPPFSGPGTKWPNRYEVDLRIENPLELQMNRWGQDKRRSVREALNLPQSASAEEVARAAMLRGNDSVILDYSPLNYRNQEIAVFDDNLINLLRRYARGGKVEAGLNGLYRRYYAGGGVDGGDPADNDTSASTAEGQAAAAGVSGGGAGPTGAGAGSPADPGPDSGPSNVGGGDMSMADPEGTNVAANMNTAVQAAAMGYGYDPATGFGDTGMAPTGFYADPTAFSALAAMVRGDISPAQALGYAAQSAIPGATIGTQIDEFGNPSRAANVDFGQMLGTVGGTMAGLATGFGPGAGRVGGMVGSALGQALGYEPGVVSYSPGVYGGPETPDTSGDDYLNYGMQYGFPMQQPTQPNYSYGPSWVPYYQGIDFR